MRCSRCCDWREEKRFRRRHAVERTQGGEAETEREARRGILGERAATRRPARVSCPATPESLPRPPKAGKRKRGDLYRASVARWVARTRLVSNLRPRVFVFQASRNGSADSPNQSSRMKRRRVLETKCRESKVRGLKKRGVAVFVDPLSVNCLILYI